MKLMSVCFSAAASKTGLKARQGPHQAAQKSMMTMPLLAIVVSRFSWVRLMTLMALSLRE